MLLENPTKPVTQIDAENPDGTQANNAQSEGEINLLDLLIVVAKRKNMILSVTALVAVLAIVYSLTLPNIYTAETRILPPQQAQSGAAAMLSQVGGQLATLAGQSLGVRNTSSLEVYAAMLQSRTVVEALIKRFDLMNVYKAKRPIDAREALTGATQVSIGKEGLIAVAVSDKNPKLAADLANAYVEELLNLTQNIAVTEASQRRLFFEKQLQNARDQLSTAEVDLKNTQESTGLIQLDSQAKAMIESVASLRAQIVAREVQLQGMRSFATQENPELVRLQNELAATRTQLAVLENKNGTSKIPLATGKVPEAGLEYIRKLRAVKYYETIFEVFARQFESAKMDESRNSSVLQVLDKAYEPEKKSKPSRSLIVLLSTVLAGFLATVWAFLQEGSKALVSNPESAARVGLIKNYLLTR